MARIRHNCDELVPADAPLHYSSMADRSRKKSSSRGKRSSRAKVSSPPAVAKSAKRSSPEKTLRGAKRKLTLSQEKAKVRGLAALNRVRKGSSGTLSEAAQAEGTTVRTIRKMLPGALVKQAATGRIRVKAGDTYSARVEVITPTGIQVATAHGSRERDLAGLHRVVVFRVLDGKERASRLRQFRGKTVGGHGLVSDFDQLRPLALAGVLGHLDTLYTSPESSS